MQYVFSTKYVGPAKGDFGSDWNFLFACHNSYFKYESDFVDGFSEYEIFHANSEEELINDIKNSHFDAEDEEQEEFFKKYIKCSIDFITHNDAYICKDGAHCADYVTNTPNKFDRFGYFPKTKEELKELVKDKSVYLGYIDTSEITDMSLLFNNSCRKDFSGIEDWDISNVENMSSMFKNCLLKEEPFVLNDSFGIREEYSRVYEGAKFNYLNLNKIFDSLKEFSEIYSNEDELNNIVNKSLDDLSLTPAPLYEEDFDYEEDAKSGIKQTLGIELPDYTYSYISSLIEETPFPMLKTIVFSRMELADDPEKLKDTHYDTAEEYIENYAKDALKVLIKEFQEYAKELLTKFVEVYGIPHKEN